MLNSGHFKVHCMVGWANWMPISCEIHNMNYLSLLEMLFLHKPIGSSNQRGVARDVLKAVWCGDSTGSVLNTLE